MLELLVAPSRGIGQRRVWAVLLGLAFFPCSAFSGKGRTTETTPISSPTPSTPGGSVKEGTLELCTRAKAMNFNPFRSEVGGEEILLLQAVTRPIMGPGGIVEKFHFAASGLEFTGQVSPSAKLARSGRAVTPMMVAKSIASLIEYRIPARGIRVSKSEAIDERTFRLTFKAEEGIENVTGVIRELLERLSAGAKSTFWVADPDNPDDFVASYPVSFHGNRIFLDVDGHKVAVSYGGKCPDAAIFDFAAKEEWSELSGYEEALSPDESIGLAILDTTRLSRAKRETLAFLIRAATAAALKSSVGTRLSDQMVERGELGHSGNFAVATQAEPALLAEASSDLKIVLHRRTPLYRFIESALSAELMPRGYRPRFVYWDADQVPQDADVVVAAFPTTKGRQKWMQGAFPNLGLLPMMTGAPHTTGALDRARKAAAATVPVDPKLVSDVEKAAFEEKSIIPLFRRRPAVLNKASSPVVMKFSESNQAYLATREKKK